MTETTSTFEYLGLWFVYRIEGSLESGGKLKWGRAHLRQCGRETETWFHTPDLEEPFLLVFNEFCQTKAVFHLWHAKGRPHRLAVARVEP